MRIYNSATHKKEEFQPIESGKVRMYVCGPTVYDNIHIGNARTFISFAVLRRWLIASGYEVTFAQNLTDVDDKIIKRANEQGRTAAEVASEFSDKFIGVMRAANVLDPDVRPRATKEIGPMIAMIKTLIEQGHAYAADNGDVYFAVRSDPNYGQVSGRNIDDLMVGARIEENEDKNDPLDFALWKAAKPGEPFWESPWGNGRPGWHIECSAMSQPYLPLDIHGGGQDLIFPHHENEIAQSEAACSCLLARYWVHNGFVTVNSEKMSKSLGNFFLVKDILAHFRPMVLRFFILSTHYRSPLDFSDERLTEAEKAWSRLVTAVKTGKTLIAQTGVVAGPADAELAKAVTVACDEYEAAMADDFNTALAISSLFALTKTLNGACQAVSRGETKPDIAGIKRAIDALVDMTGALGLDVAEAPAVEAADEKMVAALMDLILGLRQTARERKDWPTADSIRNGLQAAGIVVEDSPQGPRWKRS